MAPRAAPPKVEPVSPPITLPATPYLDDSPAGEGLTSIKSKARRLKMESGLDLIVIDYLQLMSNGNSLNRVQEVSEISRGLKSLARAY